MAEILVCGGGPAGAAAAITLARAGRRPLLVEREPAVREKVCGEFLAADAAALLAGLGVDVVALGAVPIRRAVFGAGGRAAELDLPFPAWGLPRAVLDAALLDAARLAGAEVALGAGVVGATPAGEGWEVRLADGARLSARALVLATGKHDLRGFSRGAAGGWLGLKLPLEGAEPGPVVGVLACAGGYAGLQPRPGGGANLCLALDPRAAGVAAAARDAAALLAHVAGGSALAARWLRGARPALARPLAVAGVPYGHVHRGAGPFRVGDQASVIPSLCGDGVAMALASGMQAAEAILAGASSARHHAGWAREVAWQMRLARGLSALVARAPWLLVGGVATAPALAGWAARRTRWRAAGG